MTRSTFFITACIIVLSISSITFGQTDSLSFTPPDFRLFGVLDQAEHMQVMYAQVRFILTNQTDSTQIYRFFLNSNRNMFDEKGFREIDSHDSVILTFRSDQLIKSSETDTLLFQYYPISDQSKMYQIHSTVRYDSETEILPTEWNGLQLGQLYPSPFCSVPKIVLTVPYDGTVVVVMFDLFGEVIDTLVSRKMSWGEHQIQFYNNVNVPSGVYLIQAEFDGQFSNMQKITLLK